MELSKPITLLEL
jgi:hypothetical protein